MPIFFQIIRILGILAFLVIFCGGMGIVVYKAAVWVFMDKDATPRWTNYVLVAWLIFVAFLLGTTVN